jgi:hypothetical protein
MKFRVFLICMFFGFLTVQKFWKWVGCIVKESSFSRGTGVTKDLVNPWPKLRD